MTSIKVEVFDKFINYLNHINIMNFKFTKIKTLISLAPSIILGVWYLLKPACSGSCPLTVILTGKLILFIFGFVIVFVPVYVIWSLFDKKEGKSIYNIIGIIIGVLILLAIILFFITKFF